MINLVATTAIWGLATFVALGLCGCGLQEVTLTWSDAPSGTPEVQRIKRAEYFLNGRSLGHGRLGFLRVLGELQKYPHGTTLIIDERRRSGDTQPYDPGRAAGPDQRPYGIAGWGSDLRRIVESQGLEVRDAGAAAFPEFSSERITYGIEERDLETPFHGEHIETYLDRMEE